MHFDGPVDSAVTDELKVEVLAVVREALSNIACHAHASHAEVDRRAGEEVALVVSDDGVGVKASGRQSGLASIRTRTERLGGTLRLTSRQKARLGSNGASRSACHKPPRKRDSGSRRQPKGRSPG